MFAARSNLTNRNPSARHAVRAKACCLSTAPLPPAAQRECRHAEGRSRHTHTCVGTLRQEIALEGGCDEPAAARGFKLPHTDGAVWCRHQCRTGNGCSDPPQEGGRCQSACRLGRLTSPLCAQQRGQRTRPAAHVIQVAPGRSSLVAGACFWGAPLPALAGRKAHHTPQKPRGCAAKGSHRPPAGDAGVISAAQSGREWGGQLAGRRRARRRCSRPRLVPGMCASSVVGVGHSKMERGPLAATGRVVSSLSLLGVVNGCRLALAGLNASVTRAGASVP